MKIHIQLFYEGKSFEGDVTLVQVHPHKPSAVTQVVGSTAPKSSSQRARCAPTLEKDPQPMALIFGKGFHQRGVSFALTNGVLIFQRRRPLQSGENVFFGKLRIVADDLRVRCARSKPPQDVPDGDPQAPYARLSGTQPGSDRNPRKQGVHRIFSIPARIIA